MTAAAELRIWAPLEAAVPREECGAWMWMGTADANGTPVEQYKHRMTRGYLNLDHDGQAWRWVMPDVAWCVPFCDDAHDHIPEPAAVPQRIPVAEALEWALS